MPMTGIALQENSGYISFFHCCRTNNSDGARVGERRLANQLTPPPGMHGSSAVKDVASFCSEAPSFIS